MRQLLQGAVPLIKEVRQHRRALIKALPAGAMTTIQPRREAVRRPGVPPPPIPPPAGAVLLPVLWEEAVAAGAVPVEVVEVADGVEAADNKMK